MSLKLEIGNSTCKITGLSIRQHSELKELLSYTIDPQAHYFSGSFRSPKRYLIDKTGIFPTGLLYIVDNYLKNQPLTKVDKRKKPSFRSASLEASLKHTPYPEQLLAALAAKKHRRGIISAPTGVGKTTIAALIVNELKVTTLIVVPTLQLKYQLIESFTEIFGKKFVGELGAYIAIENVDALNPNEIVEYDCVIIDEFHHGGAKTYRKLNNKAWKNIYYKFGLTATPWRNNANERLLLESILSKVIYTLSYQDAVTKGYIVPVEAYYVEVPRKVVQGHTWPQVYSELIVNHAHRNTIIAAILTGLSAASTLCLVKEIKHGENIQSLITSDKPPFAKGENSNNKELIDNFNSKAPSSLIGTTGVVGEGVDTRPTEYVVIAGLGKSKGQFMQQVGRGLRKCGNKESCKVIIFKDKSHKWTISHYNQQVKYLKEEYGVIPVKLDISTLL